MGVRWAVELVDGASVQAQIKPTPEVTNADLAEEERLAREWLVAQSDGADLSSDDDDLNENYQYQHHDVVVNDGEESVQGS